MPGIFAGFDMAAEGCGKAVLNRRHDLELSEARVSGMGGHVAWPGAAEDIGDLV